MILERKRMPRISLVLTKRDSMYFDENNYYRKTKAQTVYISLAAKFYPYITKDRGEMMKLVNRLKENWGIYNHMLKG